MAILKSIGLASCGLVLTMAAANADPLVLSDQVLDNVTAGELSPSLPSLPGLQTQPGGGTGGSLVPTLPGLLNPPDPTPDPTPDPDPEPDPDPAPVPIPDVPDRLTELFGNFQSILDALLGLTNN